MIPSPTFYVTPTGFAGANASLHPTHDPIGACILAASPGDSIQLLPGVFPPIKADLSGKKNIHLCGYLGPSGQFLSTITADVAIGSTDSFRLGKGASGFILECLQIQADDRAGLKTVSGVGAQHAIIDCLVYGPGSPHDPLWKANTKWGGHFYDTAGWSEDRVWTWSIFGEHARYFHNIQGNHAFVGGGAAMLGGCDLFFANRQNEGQVGKGDVKIVNRYTEDACIGQGGAALTFRGGMPTSTVTIDGWTCKLGCKETLTAPFNQNICGAIVVDSGPESHPGAGDAAWPGGTGAVELLNSTIEVGTIYPGRTGMIRPVVDIADVRRLTIKNTFIKVTRPAGSYPIALTIHPNVDKVEIGTNVAISGWVDWHPGAPDHQRFTSVDLWRAAMPELFV